MWVGWTLTYHEYDWSNLMYINIELNPVAAHMMIEEQVNIKNVT